MDGVIHGAMRPVNDPSVGGLGTLGGQLRQARVGLEEAPLSWKATASGLICETRHGSPIAGGVSRQSSSLRFSGSALFRGGVRGNGQTCLNRQFHPFQNRELAGVTPALTQLDDPSVTAFAVLEDRGQFLE